MRFAIEFSRSPMRNTKAWFLRAVRSGAALLILSSFAITFAQTPADTREAKLARAAKDASEAFELAKTNNANSVLTAIAKLNSAETLFAELSDKERQLAALFMMGHLQLVLDQQEPGVATLSKALAIAQELDKRELQIRILGRLGEYFFKDGKAGTANRERARNYLEQAAAVIDRTDPKPEPLSYDAYEFLGRIWISLYNPTNANKAFLAAYRLKKDKPPEESIPAIIKYAEWQIEMGYPKFAVAPLDDARRRSIAAKLPALEALITWRLGDLMAGTFRDLRNAKGLLQRTEHLLVATPDEALSLKVMVSWGKYYYASFELSKSAEYFERAWISQARIKPVGLEGELLLQMGILHHTLGDHQKAMPLLEKAVEINRAEGRKLMEMHSLRYLARCLNAVGRVEEAHKTMGRASSARGDSGQGWFSAESVAIGVDNADFFIESFQKKPGNDPAKDVRLVRARRYLEDAYGIAKRERIRDYQSIAARRLATLLLIVGEDAKAVELLNDSLISSRSSGLLAQEAGALTGLMDASLSLGNSGAATFYGKSAVNVYQQLRKKIADLTPEERVKYLSTIEATYRKLAAMLIEQGRIGEAEQVLTMLKEEELIDYVRRDDTVARELLEKLALTEDERAAMSRYDAIAAQITALGKEFDELDKERRSFPTGEFPKQQRYDELKQQLADATVTFQKFLDDLKLKFGGTDVRVAEADSSLKKTLERLKADRTAVVSTIVGEDTLNIIVTTSRTQRAHSIKRPAKEINELVAKLRQALTSPLYDPRPASQQVYDLIVKPIEGDLAGINADTIVWSLDGTLRYIPPAAIWDKQKGYLAERFSNVIVNLASRDTIALPVQHGADLSVLGVGVSKAVDGFAPLAAVPDELDCIVSDRTAGLLSAKPQCRTGVLNGRKLLDEKFTLQNFQGELGRFPIVHIASHFKLTPGDDKNSFLLLGGGDDRRFTVEKLRNEPLADVELIVLSACNTATPGGVKANGVEIEGFASIAQREGAKAVMATLWPVADTSTKDFMVEFYMLYGKQGRTKADAMRIAQMKLMNGSYNASDAKKQRADEFASAGGSELPRFIPDPKAPFAHPYFWSPFILIGNWR